MKQLIKLIDSDLELVKSYQERITKVYKVISKENSIPYILKMEETLIPKRDSSIESEKNVLLYIQEQQQKEEVNLCLNKLIKNYEEKNGYRAILKEWFDGISLTNYGRIEDSKLKGELEYTIKKLHKMNICNLDLDPQNVMVSSDWEQIRLIELDMAYFREKCGEQEFQDYKNFDWNLFDRLFY